MVPTVDDGGLEQVCGRAQDGAVEVLRGSRPVVLVSLVRLVRSIMVLFRRADQLVHGVETSVNMQSSGSDCLASMGRAGFRSALCTLARPMRSQSSQSMVVPSRAWVDEVKVLKQGDIYVGRGASKEDYSRHSGPTGTR